MLTRDDAYEITRKAVQNAMPSRTVKPETQVYGPEADMVSLEMVDAIVDIERALAARGIKATIPVGDMVGTVTVADLARFVEEIANR